ncbi:hypothetical protein [Marinigracilibium pacificum]|uniref:Lipoprotein n=1 Tax=Marinigracilibium pacificum TaxID=2729599 RepID=A0A848J5W8_9BACT|nr:hypothetical protein [Marinigracilibium pacificum]NMM50638.1 hypothetical protein [Marinigracilibium pacificum]
MKQVKLFILSLLIFSGCQERKELKTSIELPEITDFKLDGVVDEVGWQTQEWMEINGRIDDLLKFKVGKAENGIVLFFRLKDDRLISTHDVHNKKCDDHLKVIISGENKPEQVIDVFPGGYIISNNLEDDFPAYLKITQWNESYDNELFITTDINKEKKLTLTWTDSDTDNCENLDLITTKTTRIDLIVGNELESN